MPLVTMRHSVWWDVSLFTEVELIFCSVYFERNCYLMYELNALAIYDITVTLLRHVSA
jgi:hypothetical protein